MKPMNDAPSGQSQIQVLVIDDDELVRETLERLLLGAGYGVTLASDGRDGLAKLEKMTPDLIVTDIYMPNKEGVETIVDIRHIYPNIKIIAMSGGADIGAIPVLELAKMVGADHLLSKPFMQTEIVEAIESLIES